MERANTKMCRQSASSLTIPTTTVCWQEHEVCQFGHSQEGLRNLKQELIDISRIYLRKGFKSFSGISLIELSDSGV